MGLFEIAMRQERQEGRQEGLKEGRQEALTEAQEAIRKERKKNIYNMRQKKFSPKSISEILDLSLSDVKAIFKELDEEKRAKP